MRAPRRRVALPLAAGLLAVLPALGFYGWAEASAKSIVAERGLDLRFANALKHARAAAAIYSGLRLVGLPQTWAEEMVVRAGMLNERVELVVKRGRFDTTAEIRKDLHNNMVGVGVAAWLETGGRGSSPDLLVQLGKSGLLALDARRFAVEPDEAMVRLGDYGEAARWFHTSRPAIKAAVRAALQRHRGLEHARREGS